MATATVELHACSLTLEEQRLINQTLLSMLASVQFSKSKRYPAFLEYVVQHTLEGSVDALKERALGIEVFDRVADYDTGSDPIVRIAAGQVRRRMTVYFSENPASPVRFELPLGSYVMEFDFQSARREASKNAAAAEAASLLQAPLLQAPPPQAPTPFEDHGPAPSEFQQAVPPIKAGVPVVHRMAWLSLGAAAALIGCGVTWASLQGHDRKEAALWAPIVSGPNEPYIIIGKTPAQPFAFEDAEHVDDGDVLRTSHQVVLDSAIATARICGELRTFNRSCNIVPMETTSVTDLHMHPVILIGSLDNVWSQRFLAPLRYHILFGPPVEGTIKRVRMIVDRDHPDQLTAWQIPVLQTGEMYKKDFAVVARVRNDVTDSDAMVIGGVGPIATGSAADFLASPQHAAEILTLAPKNWAGHNFEVVLQTDVIKGNPGHTQIVASEFW